MSWRFGARNGVSMGPFSASTLQQQNAIAIGAHAGRHNQGSNSIAIGANAGHSNQHHSTIVLNASGAAINTLQDNSVYLAPLRLATAPYIMSYNAATKEVTYSDNISGSLGIGTATVSAKLHTYGDAIIADSPLYKQATMTVMKSGGSASLAVVAGTESSDAILYLGTPNVPSAIDGSNSAYKTAIIADGNGSATGWSTADLHFCLNGATGDGTNSYTQNATTAHSKMVIKTNGRVGIGLTNPGYTLDVNGDVYASGVNYIGRWGHAGDVRTGVAPSVQSGGTASWYFGTYNNNGVGNFADLLILNSWGDSSGGNANMIAFNKNTKGIRQFQGTPGSASSFSAWYDCVMTDANSANVTLSGTVGITSNNVLEFGSGVAGKEGNSGKIGYQSFTTGCLDVVGAGTGSDRRVRVWDKLGVGANPTNASFEVAGTSYLSGKVGINTTTPSATLAITNLSADHVGTINVERAIADASIYTVSFNQSDTTHLCGFGMVPKDRAVMAPTSYFMAHHVNSTAEWGIVSSGWDNLFSIRGSTGNVYMKGSVGIGFPTLNAYRAPLAKLTVNSNYSGGDTGGFCINAYDGAEYNLRLYPYVQAGGQVAYQFKVYNLGTAYNSMVLGYNGSVGIGTTIPQCSLYNFGAGASGWKGQSYFGNGTTGVVIGTYDNVAYLGAHNASLSAWTDLCIASAGNVGIGITNPSSKLDVQVDSRSGTHSSGYALYVTRSTTSDSDPIAQFRHANGSQGISIGYATISATGSNANQDIGLSAKGTGTINLNNNTTISGNVGIGTNAPSSKFHLKDGRMDVHTGSARFDGLLAWNDASGRAQIVLSSYYSDLVIASSQANDVHGSTLTFVTTNPSNAGDYRKWVINQGNWGNRKHMLDFGYASDITNPHWAISASNTLLTLDGSNMRVGIGSTDPTAKLEVVGSTKITGVVNIIGGDVSAVPLNYMKSGSLTIGAVNQNYGGGTDWNSNTAALLFECLTTTEIAIHDAGNRVASFLYFSGDSTNRFYIGRDMGWGTTPTSFRGSVSIAGEADLTARLCITNPNGTISHFGYSSNWNYIRGVHTQVDTTMTVVSSLTASSTLSVSGALTASSTITSTGNITTPAVYYSGTSSCYIYNGNVDTYNPTGENNLMISSWNGIGFKSYDGGVRIAMDTRGGGAYFAGNVGIGITNPGYKLDVSGAIRATTEIYVNSWFRNVGTGGLWNDTYSRGIRCADAEGNSYGNISTHGEGRNGWLGYGLGTRYCFMGKNAGEVGIHDNNNSWCIYFDGSRNCTIYGSTTLASNATVSGTLNVTGSTTLASNATVSGALYVGPAAGSGTIYLGGGAAGDGVYDSSVIETRNYASSEITELLIFKGNDVVGASGPDRIRLRAAEVSFDTYSSATNDRTTSNIRMTIKEDGSATHTSGDNSYIKYGPNTSWGGYLAVGASQSRITSNTAQCITTDGNLHLDAGNSKDFYIGYYANQAGTPNNILSYGTWTHSGSLSASTNITASGNITGNEMYTNSWFRVNGSGGVHWESSGAGIQGNSYGLFTYNKHKIGINTSTPYAPLTIQTGIDRNRQRPYDVPVTMTIYQYMAAGWGDQWAFGAGRETNSNLYFFGNTDWGFDVCAYIENDYAGAARANFTGQHRCAYDETLDYKNHEGLIVKATGTYLSIAMDLNNTSQIDLIKINEALPEISLSNEVNCPSVFGVVSYTFDPNDTIQVGSGRFISVYAPAKGDKKRVYVNSLGEGGIWVCNMNGIFINGDLITTSSIPGYGMKQSSSQFMNYTVGKITTSCDFTDIQLPIRKIKTKTQIIEKPIIIDKIQESISTEVVYDEINNRYIQKKIIKHTTIKVQKEDEVELYNEDGNIIGKHVIKGVSYEEGEVDDLDENGNIQWINDTNTDGSIKMKAAFQRRYLIPNGNIITKEEYDSIIQSGQSAYIAAFVGCTYHCG